jgi:signal transduction histidine kinase
MSGRHDRAIESLREIEQLGRDALTDLDHMLGLLHAGGPAPLGPHRAAPDIARLVADTNAAGADVRLRDECDCILDNSTGSGAYRVVQEALTNAIKHAPGARVDVTLRCDGNDYVVRIANDEPASRAMPSDGIAGGRGISGMNERVKVLGGDLSVGRDAGRFVVEARLPRGTRRRRERSSDEAVRGA